LATRASLAERLGADLHRPMRRLSRGNKHKVGLIQAMFHRPPLLVLDEPTSGLDPLVQEEFLEIVDDVRAEGRTVFFSSHVLSEVERVRPRRDHPRRPARDRRAHPRACQQGVPARDPDLR
jgi:ABC-2 type transport system ATP-binding protein